MYHHMAGTVRAQVLTFIDDINCELVERKPVTSILLVVGMTTKFTSETSVEDPYMNKGQTAAHD